MQEVIYTKHALGINGAISKAETQYLATMQGVLMQDTNVGAFVGFGEKQNELITEGVTKDNFVGFVVRDGFISTVETPNETYKSGDTATIITKGSVFITLPEGTEPKQGQFVSISGDSLAFGDTDTDSIGWRVNAVGDTVIEITTQF